jgi:hypothetical protein
MMTVLDMQNEMDEGFNPARRCLRERGVSSRGFRLRDKFIEHDQCFFDFAAAGTVDGQLRAVVEQLYPDRWLAIRAVLRELKNSDLVISDSDDGDRSCSGTLLWNRQEFDVGLGEAQFAKCFVECSAHGHTLDEIDLDADFGNKSGRTPVLKCKVAARVSLTGIWPTGGAPI